jgi:hypothetical protein
MTSDKNALYMATEETMEEGYLRTIVADFHVFPTNETGVRGHGLP